MQALNEVLVGKLLFIVLPMMEQALIKISKFNNWNKDGKSGGEK